MKKTSPKTLLFSTLMVASLLLFIGVIAGKENGYVSVKNSPILEKLVALFTDYNTAPTERVYVQTDKPLYSPGEDIWFSAYLVNTADMKPSELSDIVHVQLINPKGGVEQEMKIIANGGSAGGDFPLTASAAGGLYKLKAYTTYESGDQTHLVFEKDIQVQQVILPRLKMKLDFLKKAYGPGDEIEAKIEFASLDNKPLAHKDITWILNLDGQKYLSGKGSTDSKGFVSIKTKLPADLKTNDGLLGALIENEGRTESITRSVPIVLNKIALSFFPEGGDMVANIQSRVAFRAINEFNKPADIDGELVDDLGNTITSFSSYHFGMGSFAMSPAPGRQYHVHITRPSGIKDEYPLPAAIIAGYTMDIPTAQKTKDLLMTVHSTIKEELTVMATVRDKIYYQAAFDAQPGENKVEIPWYKFPMGVAQITLFDSKGIPRAERLVFAHKDKQMKIEVTTNKQKYQPREKVEMTLKTMDENGNAIPANLSLAVTDDKLLSFADDRSGTILSRLFLEPELKEKVEEAAFYFNAKEPQADSALDFLLLTSGWRRYTWKELVNGQKRTNVIQPEKAIIAGAILDQQTQKLLAKKKLVLINDKNNLTCTTDNDGHYTFRLKEFTGPVILSLKDTGYVDNPMQISQFSQANNFSFESKAHQRKREQEEIVRQKHISLENKKRILKYNEVYVEGMPSVTYEYSAAGSYQADKQTSIAYMPGPDVEKPDPTIAKEDDIKAINGNVADKRFEELPPQNIDNTFYYRTREFPAPIYKESDNNGERTDFRSTIYWKGGIETGTDGMAKLSFYNSDDITAFRATVEGIGGGLVGHSESLFYTQLPFSISAKIPNEAAAGDEIKLPISITNNTNDMIAGHLELNLPASWQTSASDRKQELNIAPHDTKSVSLDCHILNKPGKDTIRVRFTSHGKSDFLVQEVNTAERGFPDQISFSGEDKDKTYSFDMGKPMDSTAHLVFSAFPSNLSEMMKGLESILREPSGCFEQTSSSNYPNIMALQYMKESGDVNPKVKAQALDLLDRGYKRLVSFETPEKGYEWFGSAPGNESLTAYGLMEFNDMKEVYASVDKSMVDRTANWIMARRDKQGGFMRDSKALDNFGRASEEVTNAYIVYAMSEGGYLDIKSELDRATQTAEKSGDPYELGLVANALSDQGDSRYVKIVDQMLKGQQADGSWTGKQSITCSGGTELTVETTSLAAMALMKEKGDYRRPLEKAIKYIVGARQGTGGWGSTQTTIMALKALTKFTKYSKHTQESGDIILYMDGKEVANQRYKAGQKDEISLAGLDKYLTPGHHTFEVQYKDTKNPLPYAVSIAWRNTAPAADKQCVVKLSSNLAAKEVKTGETVRLSSVLTNSTAEGQPSTIAILGIPAGLSPQPWQLKELQEKGVYDYYEIRGNSVAIYYRQMKPNETRTINLDLKAEIPGSYEAPASVAYLYYTSEYKSWCKAAGIVVK